jgi:hypothetical protein
MLGALARAGAALGRPDYVDARARCAHFVLSSMRGADGACCVPTPPAGASSPPTWRSRLPARGAAGPLRGDLRDALVHRGPRAGRRAHRPLGDPERGGFLLDRLRLTSS